MSNEQESPRELRCVLLPLQEARLLLPNTVVVEVIGYREPAPYLGAPAWLPGAVLWQQRSVPLVHFEQMAGHPMGKRGYRARIAICHTLQGNPRLPYVGVLCNGIPRLARVSEDNVDDVPDAPSMDELVRRQVNYQDQQAWIPNLDLLEQRVAEVLPETL